MARKGHKVVPMVENSQAAIYLAVLRTIRVCEKRMELVEVYKCACRVIKSPFLRAMLATACRNQIDYLAHLLSGALDG